MAEKIVVGCWRLRRVLRSESGHIAKALAERDDDREEPRASGEQPESTPSTNREIDSMTDHLFLPTDEDADKLLRYEAMVNKQLNHAIFELERLQARRKGNFRDNFAKQSQQAS